MFSKLEFLIALRYLKSKRKEGFISVIAIFSFIGIMIGVATLIIVMSVMNGFRYELVNRILLFRLFFFYIPLLVATIFNFIMYFKVFRYMR